MQFDAIGGAEVTNKAAKLTLLDRSERSPNIYPTKLFTVADYDPRTVYGGRVVADRSGWWRQARRYATPRRRNAPGGRCGCAAGPGVYCRARNVAPRLGNATAERGSARGVRQ
jgi:hypothetical protein